MAEMIGNPKRKMFIIGNSLRAGSTIMTQIFETVPGMLTISESTGLECRKWDGESRALLKDTFRILCKPHKRYPYGVCIKLFSEDVGCVPELFEMFPDIQMLFVYRDALSGIMSLCRCLYSFPLATLWVKAVNSQLVHYFYPACRSRFFQVHGRIYEDDKTTVDMIEQMDATVMRVAIWAATIHIITDLTKRHASNIWTMDFSEFRKKPEKFIDTIFSVFSFPTYQVQNAYNILKEDSQRGTAMSRQQRVEKYVLPSTDSGQLNDVLDRYALPHIQEDVTLPNKIKVI